MKHAYTRPTNKLGSSVSSTTEQYLQLMERIEEGTHKEQTDGEMGDSISIRVDKLQLMLAGPCPVK